MLELHLANSDLADDLYQFAVEATFKQPSTSFKIAALCQHCQLARDLDLCKDVELLMADASSPDAVWPCPACRHPIDKMTIESKLIELIQKYMATYSVQDLRCQRCNQVKGANMALTCECSGAYKLEQTASDHWKKIRTISELAEYYRLDIVAEMADDCLKCA